MILRGSVPELAGLAVLEPAAALPAALPPALADAPLAAVEPEAAADEIALSTALEMEDAADTISEAAEET